MTILKPQITRSAFPVESYLPSPGWEEVIADIQEYSALKNDWDGLGATAPKKTVRLGGIELANVLRSMGIPPAEVMVSGGGTLLFIWDSEHAYVDAEIVARSHARWMERIQGQPTRHWSLTAFTVDSVRTMRLGQERPTAPALPSLSPSVVTPKLILAH